MTKLKMFIAATVIGFAAVPIVVEAQADYDYQTIAYPGADINQVFGINDRGDAVGNGGTALGNFAFVWDSKKGTFTDVAPVAGYDRTAIIGISDSGVLVGSVEDFGTGIESGLIVDKQGNAVVFDHPDAVFFTEARGINNKGLVTGYRGYEDPLFGVLGRGFIYDPKTGAFTDIVPSLFTIAQGINSKGDVVGSAIFDGSDSPCPGTPGLIYRYGWLRTADGEVTYFDVNGGSTNARGITDSGTIAGWVFDATTLLTKGFVVELDGTQCQSISVAEEDLLAFPGTNYTVVGDIKNSGAVVGSYDPGDGTISQGFIATPQ